MATFQEAAPSRATQLALSADASMLRQIIGAVAQVTGARTVYMERYDAVSGAVDVVAVCGPDAPQDGSVKDKATGNALTLPLRVDGESIGAIVCVDAPQTVALDPAHPGQIELLGTLAASALHNAMLVRQLEEATATSMEQRFRLLDGLVHYLKNTLGAAREYVQLIETESDMTTRQQGYISSSQRNIDVALRLLAELVDLVRVDTGRLPISTSVVDPGAVVRGIVRDYELANGTSGVKFDLYIADLPTIVTDVDLMRRILHTLLSNAVKYTKPGGRVEVSAVIREGRRSQDPQQLVCISVHDDGPGVAERDLVFEEIVRAESRSSTPGFRLAINRRIARLLGGDLSLQTSPTGGTSFSLWLPTASPLPADENPTLEGSDRDLRSALP
ncbi:MAG: ATP-binding protein [Longimicrobiales bacterium]